MVNDTIPHLGSHIGLPFFFILGRIQHEIVDTLEDEGLAGVLMTGPDELHPVFA
jgi:hypothetical protein